MARHRFRPFTTADLPMAERWLETPEVVRWWGDPVEQRRLMADDLDEPLMRQWIVEHEGRPFAYVQAYEAHAWPQEHLRHLPAGTQVLDVFIGEPDMLGRWHGSRLLAQLAAMLVSEGAAAVAIDPAADNLRARRASARAGFVEIGIVQADQGPVALMLRPARMPSAASCV